MNTKTLLIALVAVVVGVLTLAAYRFALVPVEEPTHYHANFAIFVDGQRVDLSGDEYMEEVGACKAAARILPTERAHLHNNNPDVAHVHHEGVTWGHLLANLGFGLGESYLATDERVYLEEGGKTLKVVVNGQPQYAIHNELIRSEDRALISYGPESEAEVLETQFPRVAANAGEYNLKPDPAGCAGAHEATLWERVRHAFSG